MLKKYKYFISRKKLLVRILLFSASVILLYGATYNTPVIFNLDYNVVNFYFETIVNIAIGYVVSLIFYILVVYSPEYDRNIKLSHRTLLYFARLNTYLQEFNELVMVIYSIDDFEIWKKRLLDSTEYKAIYHTLFKEFSGNNYYENNKIKFETNYDALAYYVDNINNNLLKIENFIPSINKNCLDILIKIQNIYIFEYFNELEYDNKPLCLLDRLDDLIDCSREITNLTKSFDNIFYC